MPGESVSSVSSCHFVEQLLQAFSLSFCFLFCKMSVIITAWKVVVRIKDTVWKVPSQAPRSAHQKVMTININIELFITPSLSSWEDWMK